MAGDWKTVFDVAAGLAGFAGLYFSIQAKREATLAKDEAVLAKEAAREARKAVRKSNVREELGELNEKAKTLLQFTQQDRRSEALVLSAGLFSSMQQARSRWARFLGEESTRRIKSGAGKVKEVSVALSLGEEELTAEQREKVIEFCHDVVALLAEESGKMMERVEVEDGDA
ncbi:MAG: hypothetical protein NVS9B14_19110 [Candidatus Acidiferrum sp.]